MPVSRETAQRLQEAGWEKETYWIWILSHDKWICVERSKVQMASFSWLPAPTLDEVMEDMSEGAQFSIDYVVKAYPKVEAIWDLCLLGVATTSSNNLADAAAEAWIKARRKA